MPRIVNCNTSTLKHPILGSLQVTDRNTLNQIFSPPCHLKQEMQSPSSALSNNLAQRGLQGNCTCTLCIPCHLAMLPIINDCKYQPCTIAPKSDTPTLPPISHLREIHEPHPRGYTLCTRGEFVTHSLDPIGHVSDLPSELNHGLSQI